MLRAEQQEQIQTMRGRKVSISEIAREVGVDRKTVRALLLQGPPGQRTGPVLRPSPLAPFQDYLKARLAAYPLSAVRLYEEILERGYQGKYTTVKDFVRPLKRDRAITAVQRFETDPGVQAQVDFGSYGTIERDGIVRKLYGFNMILGYSRCRYLEFVTQISTPILIQCHLNAFDYFGGYTDHTLYDNMSQVVLERALRTEDSKWNPLFLDFVHHFGFQVHLCWPYRPETKGKIESGVKFSKGNFFLGRAFASFEDLNRQGLRWCNHVNTERPHRETGVIPIERLEEEHLHLLDGHPPYQLVLKEFRRIDRECFLSFEGNRYSAPWRFAGREAELQVHDEWVQVLVDHVEVARHDRRPKGMGAKVRNPEHFVGLGKATRQRNLDQFRRMHPPQPPPPLVERRALAEYDFLLGGRP